MKQFLFKGKFFIEAILSKGNFCEIIFVKREIFQAFYKREIFIETMFDQWEIFIETGFDKREIFSGNF